MSIEASILALATAIERHTDTMVLLHAGSTSITPALTPAPEEIVMPTGEEMSRDVAEPSETPAPKKKAAKKKKADDVKEEPITHRDLKAYALQRTREDSKFRDPFMALLAEYGAKTVAQLKDEVVEDVFHAAQKL